jgi:predicted AAA+ superfamily ATPase
MPTIHRLLAAELGRAARAFPAVVVTGPRRAGKTTLLRSVFPDATYVLLEDPDTLVRVRSDPRSFVSELRPPVILDEIQNAPELFAWIRTRIDERPRARGQWLITGSHEAPLMRGVSESMAGRAAILELLPFSVEESPRVGLLEGGYPEALARPRSRALWFRSYVQTYLERDVRSVAGVRDLVLFRRFLALLASRHGQLLNRTELAAPLGVSVPTIGSWLDVLEVTGLILQVPPYFENLGKRLLKTQRVYLADSGLACHLLRIESPAQLRDSPFLGALFEGHVAAEIVKAQVNRGRRREIYHFRDQQGLEVDFVVPATGQTWLIEAKASATPQPAMARSLHALTRSMDGRRTRCAVVHPAATRAGHAKRALAPGVQAHTLQSLVAAMYQQRIR